MWYLDRLHKRGGILGTTQLNQFEGHRFQREEDLFVRETTQNSLDNAKDKLKPRIVFRMVTLEGARKQAFLKQVKLNELFTNDALIKEAEKDNELRSVASSRSLSLLFIEDFNTTGLDGVISDPKSNWMRFNLHGDGQKLKEDLKIGSYGYGKSVLSRAAGTRSFIVFTAIEPNAKDKHAYRLMGHTFQNLFEHEGRNYSGRGWFCEKSDADGDPVPFIDTAAKSLATQLGFTDRAAGDTGTSFLLIGTSPAKEPLSIASVRHAFETWWWPCFLDDHVDVEFWENGTKQDGPAPRLRTDLLPYIHCKATLDGNGGSDVESTTFQPLNGKDLGRLGLALAADESVFGDRGHPKAPGPRRVARTRARGGMITEYRDFGTERRVAFVGYYCAADDIDKALKLAEPAEHDEWSPVNQRLTRFPNGREIVETINERTRQACYKFQQKHSAARAPVVDRLPELERILGAAFDAQAGGRGAGGTGGKKGEQLLSVEFPGSSVLAPTLSYGTKMNRIDGVMRFQLRKGYVKAKKVGVWLLLNVAEDANQAKGEPLEVKVTERRSGKRLYSGVNPRFVLDAKPGQTIEILVESEAYPRHQTVLFDHGEFKP